MPRSLNVITYNLYMRPAAFFNDDQATRVGYLPSGLKAADVVVCQELFDDAIRTELTTLLSDSHPHFTQVTGRASATIDNGGVVIYSKYPFLQKGVKLFGAESAGEDAKANKGIRYVCVEKDNIRYHVFGTHLQAGGGEERRTIRHNQIAMLKAFVDAQQIPNTEVVLMAGDFNIRHKDDDGALSPGFQRMVQALNVSLPAQHTGSEFSHRDGKRLDYVFISNAHFQPVASTSRIRRFTYPAGDLSDHFAVDSDWQFA